MQSTNGQAPRTGKVLNSKDIPSNILPANTVYVDQGSIWANPFRAGVDGTPGECLERYEILLAHTDTILEEIDHLQGMNLLCHSTDHANVLLMLAGMNYRQRLEWADKKLGHKQSFKLAA